jgi:multidrug efflux system outer membrane protein
MNPRARSAAASALVGVIAGLALVTGCTLEPAYVRPAAPVPSDYPSGDAYKPAIAAPGGLPAADIGWREFFTDRRLQRLVEVALENNRDLRVAMLNVAEARAQYRIQRATLYPQIGGAATATALRVPADESLSGRATVSDIYTVGATASWEIDLFGRLQSLKNVALDQYLATAQARKAAQIALVSQVADQYLAVLALDEQLDVTRATLDTARESYRIVELQFNTGTGSELDVRQSQTIVEEAQANYAQQVRARAQAQNALVQLIGTALPADLPASTRLGDQQIVTDIPPGLPSDLLTRRPDIIEAEDALRAQNANIGAARAAFFPRIDLTGELGTSSARLGGLFQPGSLAWTFAPSITVPIFNAGSNQANLDLATLQKNVAIAQYEKAIQAAFREVADGLAARGTYDEQVAALQRLTQTQQRRLELANLRYKGGVSSYLDVLVAQTDLYVAQLALVTTRLQRLTNLVDLYQFLGGGWLEHTGDLPPPADAETTVGASRPTAN